MRGSRDCADGRKRARAIGCVGASFQDHGGAGRAVAFGKLGQRVTIPSVAALCWRCFEMHYFIVTLASAKAAGTFEGALGPDSTPKASLVKLCRNSSISAGVIGLFIFFSS